ncbi:MAG TPA: hypothetical protein VFE47_06830 [Tepidisphaeraceae bacterium]|nr:hypothetical protein [Tepidisphaeraceae bacterium]
MQSLASAFSLSTPTLLALALALPLSSVGCASAPELTLTSIDHSQCYRQGFTQAYTSRDANGDVDVVLLDQASEEALSGKGASNPPVRQVMHIRILWSPTSDMKAVVSNASVRWYVIGRSNPQDVLEYSGIAFVSMDQNDDDCKLRVRNAVLKPSGNHGALNDPIGPSRLEGTFTAHADPGKVNRVLGTLKTTVAAARSATPALTSVR